MYAKFPVSVIVLAVVCSEGDIMAAPFFGDSLRITYSNVNMLEKWL